MRVRKLFCTDTHNRNDSGRHGRQHRGREGQARAGVVPGPPPVDMLRVQILRPHDRGPPLHGHIQRARADVRRPPHGGPSRGHRAARPRPRGDEGRARAEHERAVRGDLVDGLLPRGLAAHGIRLPVQRAAGRKRGVEAVPEDRAGLHVEPAEHATHRGVRAALARDHGVQEVLHQVELAVRLREHNVAQRALLRAADTSHQGHNVRPEPLLVRAGGRRLC
ncbi:hypothetical protein THAOC_36584 [Thalassiosira oceanica]|uniref:Uncharacterized protein n=1 Tax=Thalassiosira oceanica TaxID=159749 RepID=K0R1N3_THAOC|nr:hypothetical protein THAOC_36584 [Thalassiosira oceanica]|eukprot:EJK44849.1 hypothetical protein THAOC_36584 [Thalassiosira oceanica]